jgi:hypothetical protein
MSDNKVVRLVGVYNADGSIRGELAYLFGRRFGKVHCSLCDITHGSFRQKSEWKSLKVQLPIPFDTYHRDDLPTELQAAAGTSYPVILAENNKGYRLLLDPEAIDSCQGSPTELIRKLEDSLGRPLTEAP